MKDKQQVNRLSRTTRRARRNTEGWYRKGFAGRRGGERRAVRRALNQLAGRRRQRIRVRQVG